MNKCSPPLRILLTGGTGLIGSAFIKRYYTNHFSVLTRNPKQAQKNNPLVSYFSSLQDLSDLNDFDVVINLAGAPIMGKRWSSRYKKILKMSRFQATRDLASLFASSAHPPHTFLSASAIGIYGNRDNELLTENSMISRESFTAQLCAEWEQLALQAQPFTRVILLRTGIVFSPDGGAFQPMKMLFKSYLGGMLGDGSQYVSWIHIQDYISALFFLINQPSLSGAVHLTAPNPVTNKELTLELSNSLKTPSFLNTPSVLLQIALGEASSILLHSQRVYPQKLDSHSFFFRFPDLSSALSELLSSKN